MWGNITLDFLYQNNFHFGFPTTRTDNLLRITHWQYWWWFWFTYFLVLYYFLVLRLFRFRLLKFRPKIATTTRPHGKWGDLIVCLLPISWCANILSNSNLILRMLEWQAESSLFTVRIRGKQWYWVYKFELKSITDVLSAPKNLGHDKWSSSTFNDLKLADNYLHIIQLRAQNKWMQQYWTEILDQNLGEPSFFASQPQSKNQVDLLNQDSNQILGPNASQLEMSKLPIIKMLRNVGAYELADEILRERKLEASRLNCRMNSSDAACLLPKGKKTGFTFERLAGYLEKAYISKGRTRKQKVIYGNFFFTESPALTKEEKAKQSAWLDSYFLKLYSGPIKPSWRKPAPQTPASAQFFFTSGPRLSKANQTARAAWINYYLSKLLQKDFQYSDNFSHTDNIEVTRWAKHSGMNKTPLKLIKNSLEITKNTNNVAGESYKPNLLRFKFDSNSDLVQHKPLPHSNYLTLKQKRYQRKKILPQKISFNTIGGNVDKAYYQNLYFLNNVLKNGTKNPNIDTLLSLYKYAFSKASDWTRSEQEITLMKRLINQYLVRSNLKLRAGNVDSIATLLDTLHTELYTTKNIRKIPVKISPYLYENKFIIENSENASKQYQLFKKNKIQSENTPVTLARRLLRTKRTLVLPAHVNITIITNSYDVIHSWFIPGLGLKLDCIPGRATHHVLHIDNAGFYYGQCAEICGRYHHHMPIRICALPFEHFLVWWHTFGLPKLLTTNSKKKYESVYASRKYVW